MVVNGITTKQTIFYSKHNGFKNRDKKFITKHYHIVLQMVIL